MALICNVMPTTEPEQIDIRENCCPLQWLPIQKGDTGWQVPESAIRAGDPHLGEYYFTIITLEIPLRHFFDDREGNAITAIKIDGDELRLILINYASLGRGRSLRISCFIGERFWNFPSWSERHILSNPHGCDVGWTSLMSNEPIPNNDDNIHYPRESRAYFGRGGIIRSNEDRENFPVRNIYFPFEACCDRFCEVLQIEKYEILNINCRSSTLKRLRLSLTSLSLDSDNPPLCQRWKHRFLSRPPFHATNRPFGLCYYRYSRPYQLSNR